MASVCGGTLASLKDAGVPIKSPVAGIAMGSHRATAPPPEAERPRTAILSDILGDEDHLGDMDFKVCGTRKVHHRPSRWYIQIAGLSREILSQALDRARDALRPHSRARCARHTARPASLGPLQVGTAHPRRSRSSPTRSRHHRPGGQDHQGHHRPDRRRHRASTTTTGRSTSRRATATRSKATSTSFKGCDHEAPRWARSTREPSAAWPTSRRSSRSLPGTKSGLLRVSEMAHHRVDQGRLTMKERRPGGGEGPLRRP